MNEFEEKLVRKLEDIVDRWKFEMSKQNITDFKKFYRLNYETVCKDMEECWDFYFMIRI